jgi:hypothetical protein
MGYEMSKWVVLIFTILNIIKEIFQMVQQVGHAVIHMIWVVTHSLRGITYIHYCFIVTGKEQ